MNLRFHPLSVLDMAGPIPPAAGEYDPTADTFRGPFGRAAYHAAPLALSLDDNAAWNAVDADADDNAAAYAVPCPPDRGAELDDARADYAEAKRAAAAATYAAKAAALRAEATVAQLLGNAAANRNATTAQHLAEAVAAARDRTADTRLMLAAAKRQGERDAKRCRAALLRAEAAALEAAADAL